MTTKRGALLTAVSEHAGYDDPGHPETPRNAVQARVEGRLPHVVRVVYRVHHGLRAEHDGQTESGAHQPPGGNLLLQRGRIMSGTQQVDKNCATKTVTVNLSFKKEIKKKIFFQKISYSTRKSTNLLASTTS